MDKSIINETSFSAMTNDPEEDYGYEDLVLNNVTAICFFIIFFVSVTGNGLLLVVLTRYEDMKNVTNLLVLNLAISDLLFTLTLPFWGASYLTHWVFGDVACKFVTQASYMGLYSSMILLTAMTVDRFAVIVMQKWHSNAQRRRRCAWAACGGAWVISIAASLNDTISFKVEEDKESGTFICDGASVDPYIIESVVWYYLQVTLLFLLPLVIIVCCYCCILWTILLKATRKNHRNCWIALCVVVSFIVCWAPINVLIFLELVYKPADDEALEHLIYAFCICRILAFSHCCMNPILYMLSQKFRRHLFNLFHCSTVQRQVRERGITTGQTTVQTSSNDLQKAVVMHQDVSDASVVTTHLELKSLQE